jgi:hypothetical protein
MRGMPALAAGGPAGALRDGLPAFDGSPAHALSERLRATAIEKPEALAGVVNGWLREDGHR